jgi:acetyl-CoA acetyltransferase
VEEVRYQPEEKVGRYTEHEEADMVKEHEAEAGVEEVRKGTADIVVAVGTGDSSHLEHVDVCVENRDVTEYYWEKEFCDMEAEKEIEHYVPDGNYCGEMGVES